MNEEIRKIIMDKFRPVLPPDATENMEKLIKMEIGTFSVNELVTIEADDVANSFFNNLLEVFLEMPGETDITRKEGAALLLVNVDNTMPVSGKSLLSVFNQLLMWCKEKDCVILLNFPDPVHGIKRIAINGKPFGLPTEIVLFTSAAMERFNSMLPCKQLSDKKRRICVLHYDS